MVIAVKHLGTVTLETEHLTLRKFRISDIEPFYRNMASDSDAVKFLNWGVHKNTYITKNTLERAIADSEYPESYIWCIELKAIGEAIGSILVTRLDSKSEKARVGYYIGSRFWGNGYMTEALSRVIRFLFEEVGLLYIECEHDVKNVASGKVMQKCGMELERERRASSVNNSGLCDTAIYGLYYSDYEKLKETAEFKNIYGG